MHASTTYKTEFNSDKGQAPALNFNVTPRPVGKGCWGGGSRWSFSEKLRPVNVLVDSGHWKWASIQGGFQRAFMWTLLQTLCLRQISWQRSQSGPGSKQREMWDSTEEWGQTQFFTVESCDGNTPKEDSLHTDLLSLWYPTWDGHWIDKSFKTEFSTRWGTHVKIKKQIFCLLKHLLVE